MKRPCIRGLKNFRKGCPEKYWDGQDGCPAWKEYTINTDGGKPVISKGCIDQHSEHWQFEALKLLEGNQRATESFRNGMCETVNNKVYPKSDPGMLTLINILREVSNKSISYDNTKIIGQ